MNLESKLHNVLQEDKMKEGAMSELQEYVSKMDLLLSEQKSLVVNYEEKLKVRNPFHQIFVEKFFTTSNNFKF